MDHDDSSQEQLGGTPLQDDRYVVVARRYRPQSFEELVGQEHVRKALANAINTNRVGHAYLFTGPRGTGKTTTARIFAKALNCVNGPTMTPCKQCDICQQISEGNDVDVIEIDGASNNGVDDVRSIRENCTVRPSRSRFKVYIVDEVHMLTKPAFNALLKTLEEPPEHVKFMFCTTDPDKLPITVLSRCQRFDLSPVEDEKIFNRLKFILEQEDRTADDDAIWMLARRAYGSLRDSQSLLEQLLSFSDGQVTVDDVHLLLGTSDSGKLLDLSEALCARDAGQSLEILSEFWMLGAEPERLAEQLLGVYRDLLSASVGCGAQLMQYTQRNEFDRVQSLANRIGKHTLLASLEIFQEMLRRVRQTTKVRILVETAVVRIASLEELDRIEQWLNVLQSPEMKDFAKSGLVIAPGGVVAQTPGGVKKKGEPSTALASVVDAPEQTTADVVDDRSAETPVRPNATPTSDMVDGVGLQVPSHNAETELTPDVQTPQSTRPPVPTPNSTSDPYPTSPSGVDTPMSLPTPDESIKDSDSQSTSAAVDAPANKLNVTNQNVLSVWERVCQNLDDLTASTLQSAESVAISVPNHLVVKFPSHYTFQKDACERPERRNKLEDELFKTTGNRFRVTFELLPQSSQPQPVVQDSGVKTTRQRRREAEQHPMVQQVAETFGAEVVRVDQPRRRQ